MRLVVIGTSSEPRTYSRIPGKGGPYHCQLYLHHSLDGQDITAVLNLPAIRRAGEVAGLTVELSRSFVTLSKRGVKRPTEFFQGARDLVLRAERTVAHPRGELVLVRRHNPQRPQPVADKLLLELRYVSHQWRIGVQGWESDLNEVFDCGGLRGAFAASPFTIPQTKIDWGLSRPRPYLYVNPDRWYRPTSEPWTEQGVHVARLAMPLLRVGQGGRLFTIMNSL